MQNGLIPTVNILYTGNDHLHAFMHRQNRTEFLCPEQLSTLACVNVWFYANRYWNTHGWCPLNLLQYSAVEHSVTPLLFCSVKFTLNLESITTVLIYIYIYMHIYPASNLILCRFTFHESIAPTSNPYEHLPLHSFILYFVGIPNHSLSHLVLWKHMKTSLW